MKRLTTNYVVMENKTRKPVGHNKSVRASSDWAWAPRKSMPGPCIVTRPAKAAA